jgi:hypothetical protein
LGSPLIRDTQDAMEPPTEGCAAPKDGRVLLSHCDSSRDPRHAGKMVSALEDGLLECLVVSGAEIFVIWREETRSHAVVQGVSRRNAPPDQWDDSFASLGAVKLAQCFPSWLASLTRVGAAAIAIDAKTLHRCFQKKQGAKAAIPMVSVFRRASVSCSAKSWWRKRRTRSPPWAVAGLCAHVRSIGVAVIGLRCQPA